MPELPEMETYRRLLSKKVSGREVTTVEVHRERATGTTTEHFRAQVQSRRVMDVTRRGKHVLFRLDTGNVLLLHLMLGGWMYFGTPSDKPDHHPQIVLTFPHGNLYFFGLGLGYLHILSPMALGEALANLGPEVLDEEFTQDAFIHRIRTKRGVLKFALVDQHLMAGIGNCYSDEICFDAGISPLRKIRDLADDEAPELYRSMHRVLGDAIHFGGYMERPLFVGDTLTGGYDERCRVYDRGDEPCVRCAHPITKTSHSGRKVFYCAHCQY